MRTIKVESEDPCETLTSSETQLVPPTNIINSLPDTPSTPLTNIKEEWVQCQAIVENTHIPINIFVDLPVLHD